jgi:hypothetical protein
MSYFACDPPHSSLDAIFRKAPKGPHRDSVCRSLTQRDCSVRSSRRLLSNAQVHAGRVSISRG